jgi:putative membrane protein
VLLAPFRLAFLELKRFRTPLQIAGLLFLLCVPLLYGAIYLWSNWNPYGRLAAVPVAVVNEDEPVTVAGQTVSAGAALEQALRDKPLLGWRFVSARQASDGLHEGRYYAVITVPSDFSARLASGATGPPQRAGMTIQLDDANNYLVGVMAQTVQSELERQVAASAVTAYFQTAFGKLGELKHGLGTAASGAGTLASGIGTAQRGSGALLTGLERVRSGGDRLHSGAAAVAAGVSKLDSLAPIARQLAADLPRLSRRSAAAAGAATELRGTVAQLTQTVADIAWPLRQLAANDPAVAADPVYSLLVKLATRLGTSAHQVSGQAQGIYGYVWSVNDAVRSVQAGVPHAQQRLRTAAGQLGRLNSGAAAVASGLGTLNSRVGSALTGAGQLHDGSARLLSGAKHLADGLSSVQGQVPSYGQGDASVLATPVSITTSNLHPADVYGRGLAPFFFSIALWVSGIVAFLLLRPVSGRLLAAGARSWLVALSAWLPVLAVGAGGALLLFGVVDLFLGLNPVHVPGTIGLMLLGVASFTAIVHVLRLAFGAAGDACALVLLMLQLVSCGGLYPVETLPLPFRALNRVVPMTYLVRGLRVTISGGSTPIMWRCALVLAAFALVSLALLWLVVARQRVWSMARLKPEVELLSSLGRFLDGQFGGGVGFEALVRDRLAAAHRLAVAAVLDPAQGPLDDGEAVAKALGDRVVHALLGERLRRVRGVAQFLVVLGLTVFLAGLLGFREQVAHLVPFGLQQAACPFGIHSVLLHLVRVHLVHDLSGSAPPNLSHRRGFIRQDLRERVI